MSLVQSREVSPAVQVNPDAFASSPDYWETLVQRRLGSRIRDLRVEVRPNGVVLQGRAATYHAKQLAQHAAMEVIGLAILANDIEVR